MELFQQASLVLNIITFILFFVLVFVIANTVYKNKFGKKKKVKEDKADYSNFNRKDTLEYLRFEDITDDMIVMDNNRRFVGVLKCDGYDFYSAHPVEKASTAQNFMGFINTITSPISYRQHCHAIDMEDTLLMYQAAYEKLKEELLETQRDWKELEHGYKKSEEQLSKEERETYLLSIADLERRIKALEFRKYHLEDQMYHYIPALSQNSNNPKIEESWVFDWTFDSSEFSVELTEEEIKKKAIYELQAKGNAMRHALSSCKVKANRCNTWELIDMCRHHSSPISAERYKLKDIIKSSFLDDIQTSCSLKEMKEEARKSINEEVINDFYMELDFNDEAIQKLKQIQVESDGEVEKDRSEEEK